MDIILEIFADDALHVNRDSVLEPDVLHCAHIPQIVLVVAMAGCVSEPLDPLLAVAAVDHKHLVADVHLERHLRLDILSDHLR